MKPKKKQKNNKKKTTKRYNNNSNNNNNSANHHQRLYWQISRSQVQWDSSFFLTLPSKKMIEDCYFNFEATRLICSSFFSATSDYDSWLRHQNFSSALASSACCGYTWSRNAFLLRIGFTYKLKAVVCVAFAIICLKREEIY